MIHLVPLWLIISQYLNASMWIHVILLLRGLTACAFASFIAGTEGTSPDSHTGNTHFAILFDLLTTRALWVLQHMSRNRV